MPDLLTFAHEHCRSIKLIHRQGITFYAVLGHDSNCHAWRLCPWKIVSAHRQGPPEPSYIIMQCKPKFQGRPSQSAANVGASFPTTVSPDGCTSIRHTTCRGGRWAGFQPQNTLGPKGQPSTTHLDIYARRAASLTRSPLPFPLRSDTI